MSGFITEETLVSLNLFLFSWIVLMIVTERVGTVTVFVGTIVVVVGFVLATSHCGQGLWVSWRGWIVINCCHNIVIK